MRRAAMQIVTEFLAEPDRKPAPVITLVRDQSA